MRHQEEVLLVQFKREINVSSLPATVKTVAPGSLKRTVGTFRDANRDGRGVTSAACKRVKRLLERAIGFLEYLEDDLADGNVLHRVREFYRSIPHERFEALEERTTNIVGLKQKIARRRNEKARRSRAERWEVLDGELVEVPSVESLRSVGRKLDLCVAKCDWVACDYHSRLRDGESKFYTWALDGSVCCLLEVDVATRCVLETSAKSNGEVSLSRRQALAILRALDATADDIEPFAEVGAFSPYLGRRKSDACLDLVANGLEYRVRAFADPRQVVVRNPRRNRTLGWSLFERNARPTGALPEWCRVGGSINGLSLGEFATLLQRVDVAQMLEAVLA